MRKITGNKLFVKALKEEGVDILFGYPGACTIDISDELYKQDYTKVILPRHEQALVHAADAYARSTGKVGQAVPGRRILLPELRQPTMTVFRLCVLQGRSQEI